MKKTKLTNLIIIDASGSMQSKVLEVREGLKALFEDIRVDQEEDKDYVEQETIVVDFSYAHDIRVLVKAGDKLDNKLADDYITRGATALYDAIGYAFSLIDKRKRKVFVSIITDGEENSSGKYDYDMITKLITEKRNKGWIITFMGVSEESIKHAVRLGISSGNTFTYANNAAGAKTAVNTSFTSHQGYMLNTLDGQNGTSGYSGYSGAGGYAGLAREAFYMSNTRGDFQTESKISLDSLMEQDQQKTVDENNSGDTNKGTV